MGTNYYMRYNRCYECDRYEEMHIGKMSAGWEFAFHGTETIRSWFDWKARLACPGVIIVDEYGKGVSLAALEKIVESTRGQLNHKTECLKSDRHGDYYHGLACWYDPEGFCFQEGEFS